MENEEYTANGEQDTPQKWHVRATDRILRRFKVDDTGRAEARQLMSHPLRWAKGDGLPKEKLAPWEKFLFGLSGFSGIAASGYGGDGQRNRLWRYTYNVNPNHITVGGMILSVFDFINDPFIGQWMDRHPMPDSTHRRIVRINHVVNVFIGIFFLFDFGFTSMQRVMIWTGIRMALDILSTMKDVSDKKFFAGITPHSDERGKLMVWKETGGQMGWPIANIPTWIMGFAKDRQQWSDYRIYTRGTLLTLPLAIAAGIVHTFVRNRVRFDQPEEIVAAPVTAREIDEAQAKAALRAEMTAREKLRHSAGQIKTTFGVLRHNKFLIATSIAHLVKMLTPRGDEYPIYRFLVPPVRVFGRDFRGEAIIPLKNQIAGTPITFMYPFLGAVVKKLGGPKRAHMTSNVLSIVFFLAQYFAGFTGPLAVTLIVITDVIIQTVGPINKYSNDLMTYEYLDYVEYKTGVRSEGITQAFNGLFHKILTGNVDSAFNNWFQTWSGIYKIDVNDPHAVAPERFRKWAWTFFTLAPLIDNTAELLVRLFLKYRPEDRYVIEAALAERRKLAEEMRGEVKEEAAV